MTTPIDLQEKIVKDLKTLFRNYALLPNSNDKSVGVNIYAQSVPYQGAENESDVFPYVEVRLEEGKDDGTTHRVTVAFVVGIYDAGEDNQGHIAVMDILDRIHYRYGTNAVVGKNDAHQTGEWSWMLQEDSYYPYHFGAIVTDFVITSIRREDPYA